MEHLLRAADLQRARRRMLVVVLVVVAVVVPHAHTSGPCRVSQRPSSRHDGGRQRDDKDGWIATGGGDHTQWAPHRPLCCEWQSPRGSWFMIQAWPGTAWHWKQAKNWPPPRLKSRTRSVGLGTAHVLTFETGSTALEGGPGRRKVKCRRLGLDARHHLGTPPVQRCGGLLEVPATQRATQAPPGDARKDARRGPGKRAASRRPGVSTRGYLRRVPWLVDLACFGLAPGEGGTTTSTTSSRSRRFEVRWQRGG